MHNDKKIKAKGSLNKKEFSQPLKESHFRDSESGVTEGAVTDSDRSGENNPNFLPDHLRSKNINSLDFTPEAEERARLLFARPCTFVCGAPSFKFLPPISLPEVAFAGRSNVGKSSLINALVEQNGLARASNTPGRTQHLNFFSLNEQALLVDLPGYGYASAPKKTVDAWTRLIKNYLRGRVSLSRVFLLIDSRHGVKENDRDIMRLLDESAVSYQLVLTKTDKTTQVNLKQVQEKIFDILPVHTAAFPDIISTSSEKKEGLLVLRQIISGRVRQASPGA